MREDFVFLHFGDGDMKEEVQLKIAECGLQAIYSLKGYQNNVEDIFSVLDVFTMSSTEEGLGSSVLDAFIYKVPVVSTNAGGLNDLLQDGRGIACAIKNASMIASGVNDLLNNAVKKQQMVDKAFEYVNRFHSMEYITNQYIELIQTI